MTDQYESKVYGMSLFAPIEVRWDTQLQELSVFGTALIGTDGQQRMQYVFAGEAAQQLLLATRTLLEILDVDAISPTPRGLQ